MWWTRSVAAAAEDIKAEEGASYSVLLIPSPHMFNGSVGLCPCWVIFTEEYVLRVEFIVLLKHWGKEAGCSSEVVEESWECKGIRWLRRTWCQNSGEAHTILNHPAPSASTRFVTVAGLIRQHGQV